MARLTKTLLRTGIYEAPQGRLHATPKRVQRWVDKFDRMQQLGIKIPVAWGHQPAALPGDKNERAKQQYWLSKFNAGYVESLSFNPATGDLDMAVNVPGAELDENGNLVTETTLEDGRKVKGAIGEVSAAIKDWTDGKGRIWKDSLVHVALTPLPVVAGMNGFKSTLGTSPNDGAFYLSLSSLTHRELAMADEKEDDKVEVEEETAAEDEAPAIEEEEVVAEEPEEPETKGAEEYFKEGLEYLRGKGVSLPEDTDMENFFERVCVACHAMEHHEAAKAEEEAAEAPDESGAGVVEEQQPTMMMSLSTAKTAGERALLAREQTRVRKELSAKIDKLVKRGMPVADAKVLRVSVDGYELSLTGEGKAVRKPVEVELSIWDKALPKSKFTDAYLSTQTRVEPRPEADEHAGMDKLAEARAKEVSRVK